MAKSNAKLGYGWSIKLGATYATGAVVVGTLTAAVIGTTGSTTTQATIAGSSAWGTVQDVSNIGGELGLDEVTHAASPGGFEEHIATILKEDELNVKGTWDEATWWLVRQVLLTKTAIPFIITYPNGATVAGTAFVTKTGSGLRTKNAIEDTITLANDSGGFVYAKAVGD